jgi:hypothetical protein
MNVIFVINNKVKKNNVVTIVITFPYKSRFFIYTFETLN